MTRKLGEKLHCGTSSLVEWPRAAHVNQLTEGKGRLGYAIGLMSSSLTGPRRALQWTSKSARKFVESSLGGEVYELSGAVDRMSLLQDFREPFEGQNPGMTGLEDCGSLSLIGRRKR